MKTNKFTPSVNPFAFIYLVKVLFTSTRESIYVKLVWHKTKLDRLKDWKILLPVGMIAMKIDIADLCFYKVSLWWKKKRKKEKRKKEKERQKQTNKQTNSKRKKERKKERKKKKQTNQQANKQRKKGRKKMFETERKKQTKKKTKKERKKENYWN